MAGLLSPQGDDVAAEGLHDLERLVPEGAGAEAGNLAIVVAGCPGWWLPALSGGEWTAPVQPPPTDR